MFNNGFELAIEVEGRRIPEYGNRGRTHVEGRRGCRYQIKFRNSRAERVLVVPSIDGLSVIEGGTATDNSSGYIVQGYSSLTISGWRTSLTEVRSFEFSDKSGSYAGKTEGTQNCGVIGARVYAESCPSIQHTHIHHHRWPTYVPQYTPPLPYYPNPPETPWTPWSVPLSSGSDYTRTLVADSRWCAGMFSQALSSVESGSSPDFNLGTAFGAPVQDSVNVGSFVRGICLATFEIYYSDKDGLAKDGIQVDKVPELAKFPQAFGGFCKPPVR